MGQTIGKTISWSRGDGPNPGARDQVARMGCGEKTLKISFGGTERALGSRSRNRLRRLKFRRARPRPGLLKGEGRKNTARHRRSLFRCCKRPSMYFSRKRNPYFDEEGVGSRQSLSAFLSSVASGVPRCAPRPAESLLASIDNSKWWITRLGGR